MTAASATTTVESLERQSLAETGFTEDEISALIEVKQRFDPFREYLFESDDEFQRMSFLKWCYSNGQVKQG